MNLRITFLMIACCSLQLHGMNEIEQAMRNCELSKVRGSLTAALLKKNPVTFGNAAAKSTCKVDMMKLLLEKWSKDNSNKLKTDPFSYAYNEEKNRTVAPGLRGKNHFLELLGNKSELIFMLTQQINL